MITTKWFTDKQKNWLLGLLALSSVFALILNLSSRYVGPQESSAGWLSYSSIGGTGRQAWQNYSSSTTSSLQVAENRSIDLGIPFQLMLLPATAKIDSASSFATVYYIRAGVPERKSLTGQASANYMGGTGSVSGIPLSSGEYATNINFGVQVSATDTATGMKYGCTGSKDVTIPSGFAGYSISENLGNVYCLTSLSTPWMY